MCHLLIPQLTAADNDESEDESYANESGEETESDEDADDVSIDEEERVGLQEDLKMPAQRKKSKSPKKDGVPELTKLAEGLTIAPKVGGWYSKTWTFPYVVYAYKDEELPVEHMVVEVLAPTVPLNFIKKLEVTPCGLWLKIEIPVPRWFFESGFIERKFRDAFHGQHIGVECFDANVTQPIRKQHKDGDPMVMGDAFMINLPKKCVVGDVTWRRGTFRTRNMEEVHGQTQFNFVISVHLKTTRVYEVRNEVLEDDNFAGLDDDDAL